MNDDLGPLGDVWDAWTPATKTILKLPWEHFYSTMKHQCEEYYDHMAAGNSLGAAKECVDFMSIALNALRHLGYTREEIATLILGRVTSRYIGQTAKIIKSYQKRFGI